MLIEKNKVVGIHYTISIENNEIVYSTLGFDPEEYVHGSISIFPAVAKALENHNVGDEVQITVPASKAYGVKNEKLIYQIANELFNDVESFEVGTYIQVPNGGEAKLIQKNNDHLLVDANHPLAGVDLLYKITVVSIRDASENEIKWGRVENEINTCSGESGCC